MLTLKIVLHTIQNRYAQHSIYTYSGIVLIAVNPFQRVTLYGPEIIQAYSGRRRGELEPHLFAIAEDAYTAMQKEGMGQTIIVSGERYCFIIFVVLSYSPSPSGAGKTESVIFLLLHCHHNVLIFTSSGQVYYALSCIHQSSRFKCQVKDQILFG